MRIGERVSSRLSIGNKIGLLLAVMLIVAGINVAAVYFYQSQASTLGNSVNYAGQQRMLSQRMAFTGYMLSQGHDDDEMMQASIDMFDRNLEAITEGGEINGQQLQPAPKGVSDELQAEREAWQEYRRHAQTLVDTDPYNPSFQTAMTQFVSHRSAFVDANRQVANAYSNTGESYMAERHLAQELQTKSQRIYQLALEIEHVTSQPGTESREKVQLQESERVSQLQAELREATAEYDAALRALESGGTYEGMAIDSPPAAVAPAITTLGEEWETVQPHASTIATEDRLNPEFWTSLSYVETHSDPLKSVSNDAVVAFSRVSTERIGFMQSLLVALFGVNVLVFLVGFVAARRIIGDPIREIADTASELSRGNVGIDIQDRVSVDPDPDVQAEAVADELVHLTASFDALGSYLSTVADQAEAIANQEFEAAVLDREVPGTFGESIARMSTDVETAQRNAEQARQEVEELNEAIETKARDYNEAMETAAAGDLTVRVDAESESEAMAHIGAAFNEMVADIETTVVQVQRHADEVAEASDEVSSSTDEIQAASEDVAESVQEISHGADDQARRLQRAADEMNDLSATVEEIASSAGEVSQTTSRAVDRAAAGREQAADATAELDAIESHSSEATAQIRSLDEEIDAINEIVQLISEIAEQTNLLALNASIEAARAGEAGEGFAVVADEIKTLANEAASATADIEAMIDSIQSSTGETVAGIEQMRERVERGSETITEAIGLFEDIADSIEAAENGVTEISEATDDQAASTEEVVAMVEEVTDVSEQTASEATNVSSATEEQTASINTVSESVRSLSTVADDLYAEVEQFDVRGDATAMSGDESGSDASPAVGTDGGMEHTRRSSQQQADFDWEEP